MKKKPLPLIISLAIMISILPGFSHADKYQLMPEFEGNHAVTAGAKMHVEHSVFKGLPFDDGDFGYLVAYEYHEGLGLWQVGAEFAPSPDGDPEVDYVLTPQVSLILQDRIFRAGLGALWSYVARDTAGAQDPADDTIIDGWSNIYYQFNIGLNYTFQERFSIGVDSYYVFEKWGSLNDFDIGDLEFGASFSIRF